jgi:CBS domain containing-hemolysin-like protein
MQHAEGIAVFVAPAMTRLARIASPVVSFLTFSTELVLRMLGLPAGQSGAEGITLGNISAEQITAVKTKLAQATIWLTDISTFDEMNKVWDAWVAPGCTPARATVESKLAAPQFTVEIAVVAGL